MKCEEKFFEIYGRDCEGLSFSPYRICPIGAHSDHNLGKITGLAIDKGIHIAFRPKHRIYLRHEHIRTSRIRSKIRYAPVGEDHIGMACDAARINGF